MRRVFEDRKEALARGAQARADIAERCSVERSAVAITKRLLEIRSCPSPFLVRPENYKTRTASR
jgi:hypothetical protein